MILASNVISEGMDAFKDGVWFTSNPYQPLSGKEEFDIVDVVRFTPYGRQLVSKERIRIAIDYHRWWLLGWNLAEAISRGQFG